jgi:hypothetical protein
MRTRRVRPSLVRSAFVGFCFPPAARPCRHAVGDRWQVDETYVKVAGQWRYVDRPIDQFGDDLLPATWHRTDQYANNRSNATTGG